MLRAASRYQRILARINSSSPEECFLAKRVLGWMSVATRPLTLREIEDACAVRTRRTIANEDRPISSIPSVCGPIVEVLGEDTLLFVHFSAKWYLIDTLPFCYASAYSNFKRSYITDCTSGPFIDVRQAHLNLAMVCARYLNFRCFDRDTTAEESEALILNGDFRLYDYVYSNWIKHALEAYKVADSVPELAEFSEEISLVLRKRISAHVKPSILLLSENESNTDYTKPHILSHVVKLVTEYRTTLQNKEGNIEG
jgi:hypothetical protein